MRFLKYGSALVLTASIALSTFGIHTNAEVQKSKVATSPISDMVFNDLSPNHWAHSVVQNAVKKGYLYGYADGTFRPSANVTRAEMAAILSRLSDTSDRSTVTFSDVSSTHWAHDAISESIALGLIKPSDYANGKFDPNKIMTRQEITNWIANFLISNNPEYDKVRVALGTSNLTLLPIAEFTKGTFPKANVGRTGIVIGTGIMGGYTDGTYKPTGNTNRAEIASIIFRLEAAMKKSPTEFKHLNELVEVAKTGTNMLSIGMKQKNEGRDFSSLRQEKHALLNGNGHVRINRLILLDARDRNKLPDSVYAAMFKDTVREALTHNPNYGQQIAIVEHAYKPTKTTPNAQWYGYGRASHDLVGATDMGSKTYADYGLKRATDYFTGWQFDENGEQKMWYMNLTNITPKRPYMTIRDTVNGRGYWWNSL